MPRRALVLTLMGILASIAFLTQAITEDEDSISLRDANSTKDRPRIEAYDMDEETQ